MTENSDANVPTELQKHEYKILAAAAVLLVAVGTTVFSWLEGWSTVDSLYFSVVTVTTVGYGDITPDTDAAKLFTVLYILAGISIIGTFLDARLRVHSAKRAKSHGQN